MTRKQLINAFSPAQELHDSTLFTGRREQVRSISDALRAEGSCPVIYGHRGLGKTSLAIQGQLLALGGESALSTNDDGSGAPHDDAEYILQDDELFLTYFVTCSDSIRDFADLQDAILHEIREVEEETDETGMRGRLVERQTKNKISIKYYERETTKKYLTQVDRPPDSGVTKTELIYAEIRRLTDAFDRPVLVIIDELDRVKDLRGLASFVKNSSSTMLKLMLVGIADSLADLGLDHPSIERGTWAIQVPPMAESELAAVVDKAVGRLSRHGVVFAFDQKAQWQIARIANGFPWFVHVIGQEALLRAWDGKKREVTVAHVRHAVEKLATSRFSRHFSDLYLRAVENSVPRERVLRVLARWPDQDMPTKTLHDIARAAGVRNPASCRKELASIDFGAVVYSPMGAAGYVRFKNEMFKHYVRLRDPVFADVAGPVDSAYEEYRR